MNDCFPGEIRDLNKADGIEIQKLKLSINPKLLKSALGALDLSTIAWNQLLARSWKSGVNPTDVIWLESHDLFDPFGGKIGTVS